jgi:hypothetical protein
MDSGLNITPTGKFDLVRILPIDDRRRVLAVLGQDGDTAGDGAER